MKGETAILWLYIEAEAQAENSRSSQASGAEQNLLLGLSSVYELDLRGRIRSAVDAHRYQVSATYLDSQTAAISPSARIAAIVQKIFEDIRTLL